MYFLDWSCRSSPPEGLKVPAGCCGDACSTPILLAHCFQPHIKDAYSFSKAIWPDCAALTSECWPLLQLCRTLRDIILQPILGNPTQRAASKASCKYYMGCWQHLALGAVTGLSWPCYKNWPGQGNNNQCGCTSDIFILLKHPSYSFAKPLVGSPPLRSFDQK